MKNSNKITKAMILAAGLGTRMGELTKNTPKPLLEINTPNEKKALIELHLTKLAKAGITDCLINTYLYPEKFLEKLGSGEKYGLQLHYSHEKEILGTAGGIVQALDFFEQEYFILINGDVYTDFDFQKLVSINTLNSHDNFLAHLILTNNPAHNPKGDFCLDKNNNIALNTDEKLTYTGIAIYHPNLFKGLSSGYSELGELLRQEIKKCTDSNTHTIIGEYYNGFWLSVDTPDRFFSAEENSKRSKNSLN